MFKSKIQLINNWHHLTSKKIVYKNSLLMQFLFSSFQSECQVTSLLLCWPTLAALLFTSLLIAMEALTRAAAALAAVIIMAIRSIWVLSHKVSHLLNHAVTACHHQIKLRTLSMKNRHT